MFHTGSLQQLIESAFSENSDRNSPHINMTEKLLIDFNLQFIEIFYSPNYNLNYFTDDSLWYCMFMLVFTNWTVKYITAHQMVGVLNPPTSQK